MALMVTSPGQYILGGISAPRTGIAEEFQAGLRENLARQDARQIMRVRQQQMDLTEEQAELARQARAQFGRAMGALESAPARPGLRLGGEFLGAGAAPSAQAGLRPPTAGPGAISRQYESGAGGVGTISTGARDPGGVSYGEYQLSSNAGTMAAFLASPQAAQFAPALEGLEPGTPQFNEAYNALAAQDPEGFAAAQRSFLEETHYNPVRDFARSLGINVNSPAIQEALWSQSIQHGGRGNRIVLQAVADSGVDLQDEEAVIRAIYQARGDYVSRIQGVPPAAGRERYAREMQDVLRLSKSSGAKTAEESQVPPAIGVAPSAQVKGQSALPTPRFGQFDTGDGVAPVSQAELPPLPLEPEPRDESRVVGYLRRGVENLQENTLLRYERLAAGLRAGGGVFARGLGYLTDRPSERAAREEIRELSEFVNSFQTRLAIANNPRLMDLLEADPMGFMEQYGDEIMGRTEPTAEEPPAPEEPAASTAGVRQPEQSPVTSGFAAASAQGEEPSALFTGAPELVLQGLESLDRQRAVATEMARYYSMVGDTQGFNAMAQNITAMDLEQGYLNGMVAIIGMQQGNFAPLQQVVQQQYPGRQVEVRPYTDRTVEFFVDGVSQGRDSVDNLVPAMRTDYDRQYQEAQAALAARLAEREDLAFEVTLREGAQLQRELALAEANALIESATRTGQWDFDNVSNLLYNDATGEAYVFEPVESGRGRNRRTDFVLRTVSSPNMRSAIGVPE